MIPSESHGNRKSITVGIPTNMDGNGKIELVDLEKIYEDKVRAAFDTTYYPGCGDAILPMTRCMDRPTYHEKLFPEAIHLRGDFNPSFHGQAPEPIRRNLNQLIKTVSQIRPSSRRCR
ncbi:MAG: hypothetical protein IPP42_02785 [Saprospiraceae bacterium]|nr:hypothetical protein [Saprospiraceae bacterium]